MADPCTQLLTTIATLSAGVATKKLSSTTSNLAGPITMTSTNDCVVTATCPLNLPLASQPSLVVCGFQGKSVGQNLSVGGNITVFGNCNIGGSSSVATDVNVAGTLGVNSDKGTQYYAVGSSPMQLIMQQGVAVFPPFSANGFIPFPITYAALGFGNVGIFTKCFNGAILFEKYIYGIEVGLPFVSTPLSIPWFAIGPSEINTGIFTTVTVTDPSPAICGISAPLTVAGGMDIEAQLCIQNGLSINNGLEVAGGSFGTDPGSIIFNGPVFSGLDTRFAVISFPSGDTIGRSGSFGLIPSLGTFTVFNDTLTTNTIIMFSRRTFASITSNTGFLSISNVITGVGGSFTVNSTNTNDNGMVIWFLIEQA
jgi:hypothetical protein